MVSRSAKNRYTWHGRTKLAQTLAILKKVGEEHRYGQQMQQIRQRILDKEFDFDGEEKENEEVMADMENGEQSQKELFFVELPGVEFKAGEKLSCCVSYFRSNLIYFSIRNGLLFTEKFCSQQSFFLNFLFVPSSLRQQQEGQISEGDEPEVCHALPGV